ncbi:MAG: FecR domain-containing protein, partial [Nitrospiraceae bacterium]
ACVSYGKYDQTVDELEAARDELNQAKAAKDALVEEIKVLKDANAKLKEELDRVSADLAALSAAVTQGGRTGESVLRDLMRQVRESQAARSALTQELEAQRQRNENNLQTIRRLQKEPKAPQPAPPKQPPPAQPRASAPSPALREPAAPPLPAKSKVGTVLALTGTATVNHRNSTKIQALAVKDPVYDLDLVLTGPTSKLKIRLFDGAQFTLGERSSLEVSDFGLSSEVGARNSLFTLAAGTFRALVNKLSPRDTFVVQMPTAVAAVRGTDWAVEARPDATALLVIKGQVAVSNQDPDIPGEVLVTEGEGTDVKGDQPPGKPKKWGQARIKALLEATNLR